MKATLGLAEISEEKDEHIEEAIALYEEADQKSRDLPKGQISETTLITTHTNQSRLLMMYSTSKVSNSPKALPVYEAEYQRHHTKYGYSHRDSLTWLSFLVLGHAAHQHQNSLAKAKQSLQISAIEILNAEKNTQKLSDSGAKLADIYIKADLRSDAEKFSQSLRRQLIFGSLDISKSHSTSSTSNLDRRSWVFLVSFDTTLIGDLKSYSSIMAALINEICLYDGYRRVAAQKSDFLTTISYGSRLLQFMANIKDEQSHTIFHQEVLHYFGTKLEVKFSSSLVVRRFFELVIAELPKRDVHINVYKSSYQSVTKYVEQKNFQEAYEMAYLVDRFQRYVGGF